MSKDVNKGVELKKKAPPPEQTQRRKTIFAVAILIVPFAMVMYFI